MPAPAVGQGPVSTDALLHMLRGHPLTMHIVCEATVNARARSRAPSRARSEEEAAHCQADACRSEHHG